MKRAIALKLKAVLGRGLAQESHFEKSNVFDRGFTNTFRNGKKVLTVVKKVLTSVKKI